MATDSTDFALLLEATDPIERDLAQNLLETAGIPCLVDKPDLTEAGLAGNRVPGVTRIYVPRSALPRARALLDEAWGDPERAAAGST